MAFETFLNVYKTFAAFYPSGCFSPSLIIYTMRTLVHHNKTHVLVGEIGPHVTYDAVC